MASLLALVFMQRRGENARNVSPGFLSDFAFLTKQHCKTCIYKLWENNTQGSEYLYLY